MGTRKNNTQAEAIMDHAYILQNKDREAVAIAIEEDEAMKWCRENEGTYRMVPLHLSARIEIKIMAPTMPKELLKGW